MVREGGEELGQEAAEEQRVGGAGEDHQHGGSELKGKMSSSLSFLGSLNVVLKMVFPCVFYCSDLIILEVRPELPRVLWIQNWWIPN